jgi:L-threonylcarbamoyladenylate synthase
LLKTTGPLVAPSANWEGHPPASTIAEAKRYFGKRVDAYVDIGPLRGKPSKLVQIQAGKAIALR